MAPNILRRNIKKCAMYALNTEPLILDKVIYSTPPEYSSESGFLLDTNAYRNFNDQHGFSIISFSQAGQDKIVETIMRKCGITNPSYLDVGCNHPVEISNTALFYRGGSCGVVVDASEAHRHRWELLRPKDIFVNAAVSPFSGENTTFYMLDEYSGRNSTDLDTLNEFIKEAKSVGNKFNITKTVSVKTRTINEIVDAYCSGKFPNYLSIDIEGLDLKVLKSIDFSKSAPIVISIEDSSPEAIDVLNEKGFQPVICVGDIIAVHNDFISIIAPWMQKDQAGN